MTATLTATYPPAESLIPTSSWKLEICADEASGVIMAHILWNDNDRATGAWNIPLADLERLVAFAKKDPK